MITGDLSFAENRIFDVPAAMKFFRDIFAIDLRALACVRVAMAVIIIWDLAIRGVDLGTWISDSGLLPRDAWLDSANWWHFSLYLVNGSTLWAAFLTFVSAGFALMLLVGWRTRLATIGCFIMLMSLHNRMPYVLQGGDSLLLLLLFWSIFLPLGARFSVDMSLSRNRLEPNRYVSVATAGILIQAMSVYLFSAFLKSSPEWVPDGTAIYYALNLDRFATPIAHIWKDWLWLSKPLSIYVWWLELFAPLLMFTPILRVPVRTTIAFLFIALEIGFIFNLRIGLFPFISIVSIVLFLQTEFWDWLARRSRPSRSQGLAFYYDDGCSFCEKTCHMLRTFLGLGSAKIAPAQSVPEIGELLEREFSWVVTDRDGNRYTKSAAMATAFAHSPWLSWFAPLIRTTESLCNRLYNWVGNNRGVFGNVFSSLFRWRENAWRPGIASQFIAAFFIVYIGWWNMSTISDWNPVPGVRIVPEDARVQFPEKLEVIRNMLRLNQRWNMFAAHPAKNDGWIVVPGILENGELVDAKNRTPGPPSFAKPRPFYETQYGNYRWRKYLTRLARSRYKRQRRQYARWLCKTWNETAADQERLRAVNIYFIVERTPPPGEAFTIRRRKLGHYDCLNPTRKDLVERALRDYDSFTALD